MNETSIRVRYQETDKMGVVYHSNYLVWFEIGRTEFFRKLGLEYRTMEEDVLVPVVDVSCKYRAPAKYDDEIIIRTKVIEFNSVKIRFNYEIIRKIDKEILATGHTTHAFTNNEFKIINLKKCNKMLFDRINKGYINIK